MGQVQERLAERGITCELTEAGCDWLVKEGFDVSYGARPLRRAIQRHLENQLSRGVLAGEFGEGDHVVADVNFEGDGLALSVEVLADTELAARPDGRHRRGEWLFAPALWRRSDLGGLNVGAPLVGALPCRNHHEPGATTRVAPTP